MDAKVTPDSAMEKNQTRSLWSKIIFGWMTDEIQKGNMKPLEYEDITRPYLQVDTKDIHREYNSNWETELRNAGAKPPSLLRVILRSTSTSYKIAILFYLLLFTACRILLPVLLNFVLKELSFASNDSSLRNGTDLDRGFATGNGSQTGSEKSNRLYLYLGGMLFVAMIQPFIKAQYYYRTVILASYFNSGLTGLVYAKILRTQRHKLDSITSGHVINLVSKDLEPFHFVATYVPYTIMAPVEIILVSLLLWKLVGLGSLAGMGYLVFLVLYQYRMGKVLEIIRHCTAVFTDRRLRLINDVIYGIRVVKMNTLEWILGNMIGQARRKEIQKILQTCTIVASFLAFQTSFTIIATFVSMVTLMLSGHVITPEKAFTTLTFMSVARKSGLEYFAYAVKQFADCRVSLARVAQFLLVEEEVGTSSDTTHKHVPNVICINDLSHRNTGNNQRRVKMLGRAKGNKTSRLCLKNKDLISYRSYKSKTVDNWNKPHDDQLGVLDNEARISLLGNEKNQDNETPLSSKRMNNSRIVLSNLTCDFHNKNNKDKKDMTLIRDIDLELGPGSLTALIGRAGSGKSVVLRAILGEIPIVRGTIDVNGSIGFVSQTSWLFSGTVRENILFGLPLDQDLYDKVIHACALREDFDLLPHGDATFIGERGLSLSGGQRARISLARAVYHDCDIYLLDDPLSAVDAKVGRHIFEECIMGLLSHRVRLLATHHLHYLNNVPKIIVLDHGCVIQRGSFAEIASRSDIFNRILDEMQIDDDKKNDEYLETKQREYKGSDGKLGMAEEDRNVGNVSVKTYWRYFRSYSSLCGCLLLVLLCLIPEGTSAGSILWLSLWSSLPAVQQSLPKNLLPYISLSLTTLVSSFARAYAFFYLGIKAAEKLHNQMIGRILQAPVRFFDTNPTGRILNRFSQDTCGMEDLLLTYAMELVTWLLTFLYCCVMVSIVNPFLFLASIPLMVGFGIIARYFLRAAREIKRLDAIACSPLYDHFSETFEGAVIIRSFKKEASNINTLYRCRDLVNRLSLTFTGSKQWLALRVELLCFLFLAAVSLACILTSKSDALTGLSITYALEIISTSWSLVVEVTNTENSMTSVERVLTYTELPQEPGYQYQHRCPKQWPTTGSLSYNDVSLTYTEDGSLALSNVTFRVNPGEKVGIVGRTGAGKSSIISALFRMPELHSGNIQIDDVIINTLDIRDSRSAIACIPQNPMLFTESLRFNLDPLGERSDADLWVALEEVRMRQQILRFYEGLSFKVSEGGTNFSVGERQLLCMARALLQGKKIIILDEATAHIDFTTDQIIQTTIREKLRDRTVITIAHRLDTVLDYDKIIVLEGGRVVEIGSPSELVSRSDSMFGHLYKIYTSGKSH